MLIFLNFFIITCLLLSGSSSTSEIYPTQYNIFNAVSFDGSNLTNTSSGCIMIGSGVRLRCFSTNGKLVDGDIGPMNSISDNLGEFFAFSRYLSGDSTSRITFTFAADVSSAVLYFFNSPNNSIGLPMINVYGESSQLLNYVFDNNDDLRQSDSQLRNVTLNIQLTDVVQLDFIFNTSIIDWLLISEVKFYNNISISPLFDPIVFQDGLSLSVTLGPDNLQSSVNLSCTVVNVGSFEWEWQYNENVLDLPRRSQILIGDATRTSILTINKLRYTDTGNYTCIVKYLQGVLLFKRFVILKVTVIAVLNNMVSVTIGDNVTLSCEVYGYLPPNVTIIWNYMTGEINNGEHYNITTNTGSLMAIDFNGNTTNSIVSNLVIYNVNNNDNGTYTCNVGMLQKRITLNVFAYTHYTSLHIQSTVMLNSKPTNTHSSIQSSPSATPKPIQSKTLISISISVALVLVILFISVLLLCFVLIKSYRNKLIKETFVGRQIRYNISNVTVNNDLTIKNDQKSLLFSDAIEMQTIHNNGRLKSHSFDLVQVSELGSELLANPLYQQQDEAIADYNREQSYDVSLFDPQYDYIGGMYTYASLTDALVDMTDINTNMPLTTPTDDGEDAIYAIPLKPLYITQESFNEIKPLGTGQFGDVILAETVGLSLKDLRMSPDDDDKSVSVQVAVKKMKEDSDPKSWEAFDKEVKFMSQLNHVNLIHLLAVSHSSCTEHFIVMEYMENGDLNQFLLNRYYKKKHPPSSPNQISPQVLLSMCIQIANGMTYLASNNYIHRDLASRNCLVGQNYEVKIGDFGLSRDLYDSAYYRVKGKAKMPIRWMSTECYYGKFSEKSDVWAYGVTVWEIYTMGREQPYVTLLDQDVVEDALKGPHRTLLSKPSYCPQEVYDIIREHCWSSDPGERAHFKEVHRLLVEVENKLYY